MLFALNKRFFDRPVEVSRLLQRAVDSNEWPENGETVRILKRLSELEKIFWEKRYQPIANLQKYVCEAWELSIELTTVGTESNQRKRKAPAVCATISFTGLLNIFVISVTTRQLAAGRTQPWKEEAESVTKALSAETGPADDLVLDSEMTDLVDKQDMVVDNEVVSTDEGELFEEVTRSVTGLEMVKTVRKVAEKVNQHLESDVLTDENQADWKAEVRRMDVELKHNAQMFESFEKQLVSVKVDAEEEVRHRNQQIESMLKELTACKHTVTQLSEKATKSPRKVKKTFLEGKALQASTPVLKATRMSLRETLPKELGKDRVLLNTKCRPVLTGEGNEIVILEEVKGITNSEGSRKKRTKSKNLKSVCEASTSKSGEIGDVKLADRNLGSSSTVWVPELEKLDTQGDRMDVSDDSLELVIDEDISEVEIGCLQNTTGKKERLKKAEADVRADKGAQTKQGDARQIGIDRMRIETGFRTVGSRLKLQKQLKMRNPRRGIRK